MPQSRYARVPTARRSSPPTAPAAPVQPLLFEPPASVELVLSVALHHRIHYGRGQYPATVRGGQCDECVNVIHEANTGARRKGVALGKEADELAAYILDQTRGLTVHPARVRRHVPDKDTETDVLLCNAHAALWKARDDERWPLARNVKAPIRARRV